MRDAKGWPGVQRSVLVNTLYVFADPVNEFAGLAPQDAVVDLMSAD